MEVANKYHPPKKINKWAVYGLTGLGLAGIGWYFWSISEYKAVLQLTDEQMVRFYKTKRKQLYPAIFSTSVNFREHMFLLKMQGAVPNFQDPQKSKKFREGFIEKSAFYKQFENEFINLCTHFDFKITKEIFLRKHNLYLDEIEKNETYIQNPPHEVYKLALDHYKMMKNVFLGSPPFGFHPLPIPEGLTPKLVVETLLEYFKEVYLQFPGVIESIRARYPYSAQNKVPFTKELVTWIDAKLNQTEVWLKFTQFELEDYHILDLIHSSLTQVTPDLGDKLTDYLMIYEKLYFLKITSILNNTDVEYQGAKIAYLDQSTFKVVFKDGQ